jgi:hypothetical protein
MGVGPDPFRQARHGHQAGVPLSPSKSLTFADTSASKASLAKALEHELLNEFAELDVNDLVSQGHEPTDALKSKRESGRHQFAIWKAPIAVRSSSEEKHMSHAAFSVAQFVQ